MRRTVLALSAVLGASAIATTVFAQQPQLPPPDDWHATGRYLPEYTKDGDLVLPKNFHEWVYVGVAIYAQFLKPPPSKLP